MNGGKTILISHSEHFSRVTIFHTHYIMKRFRNMCLWGMQDINFLGVIQFRGSEEKRRKRVFKKNSPSITRRKLGVIDRSLQ